MCSKREKGGRYMISKKGEKRPQLPSGEPLIVVDLNSRKIDTAKYFVLIFVKPPQNICFPLRVHHIHLW